MMIPSRREVDRDDKDATDGDRVVCNLLLVDHVEILELGALHAYLKQVRCNSLDGRRGCKASLLNPEGSHQNTYYSYIVCLPVRRRDSSRLVVY